MFKSLISHKLTILLGLFLLLQLPLHSVLSLNHERQAYRNEALEQITASSSGPQRLTGPVLVIPYEETKSHYVEEEGKYKEFTTSKQQLLFPETLAVTGDLQVEPRKLGIYQSQLFHSQLALKGRFTLSTIQELKRDNIQIGKPYLAVVISDARGILQVPALQWGKQSIAFQPGAHFGNAGQGMHAPLDMEALLANPSVDFEFALALQGTDHFDLVPVGANSSLSLTSNWPHPSFIGQFLPRQHQISDQGFDAQWASSWFANNMQERFSDGLEEGTNGLPAFTVSLIEPVDHYQQNERAIKYAELFIGLTFLSFFLFELLKQLRLHPIQYALVSMAQIVFYLVLLAFSEQIGFALAYLAASVACVGLLAFYASHLLGGLKRGFGFACLLALLYAILYGLMQAEDIALLLGSVLLFVVLALVMIVTRKVDWYQLGRRATADSEQ
jgi:inner membrane protein